MDRKVFTALLLSVIVVGLIVLTFAIFRPFLIALLWAAVLATVSYRVYEWLCRVLRDRRTLAALLMTALVLIVLIGPFLTLTLHFTEDAIRFVNDLRSEGLQERVDTILKHPWVQKALRWAEEATGERIDRALIIGELRKILVPVGRVAGDVVGFLFSLLMGVAFVTLAVFYFYRDGRHAVHVMRELLPMSEDDRNLIFHDIHGAIVAAVRGGLVTALAQGLLGFIILFILGFERAVLWAAVIALASFIPMVGTALVWLPMAAVLAIEGEVAKAVILTSYGAIVIGSADNFLRPILVGQHMEAHPLLLFFGILGGIVMFGFSGIILGPVAVAFLNVTARLLRREFGQAREAPAPG
jgi:predicted PurR-regulated permease PerM